jgi:CMP-N,N'-diacetyllegionaminic acid synthase
MNVLITICARGGSKGIPGKNIKYLNGKPLIYYSILVAQQFQKANGNTDIVLSTDSPEIKMVAEQCGLVSDYIRPKSLAGDKVGKIDVLKDVLIWQESQLKTRYDFILDLDVTSPLRNIDDLFSAFKQIKENDEAVNLFSVSHANRSPYFNMVELKENGFFAQVKQIDGMVLTRQSAPKVYDMNASFYFYKRTFFDLGYKGAVTKKSLIYIVPHICFDLDHPIDFEIISFLMEQKKLDFEL